MTGAAAAAAVETNGERQGGRAARAGANSSHRDGSSARASRLECGDGKQMSDETQRPRFRALSDETQERQNPKPEGMGAGELETERPNARDKRGG